MRKGFRVGIIGILIAFAGACVGSAASWVADFTPSTWNPAVGDVVNFSVCDSCLGGGAAYRYLWDFNNDGVVDVDTASTIVACTFNASGFYEVKLTVRDSGGREQTRTKGIVAGDIPAYGVRQIIVQDDGSVFVSVTLTVNESVAAPGLLESVPAGWQMEVIDADGALTRFNSESRQMEVGWLSAAAPGDEIVFSYRFYTNYASTVKGLSGELSGYVGSARFASSVCGELGIP